MSIEIPNYPLREWIDELQPSQKEAFNRLLGETGDAAETARLSDHHTRQRDRTPREDCTRQRVVVV